jgi:hypothetical protein
MCYFKDVFANCDGLVPSLIPEVLHMNSFGAHLANSVLKIEYS